MADDDIWSQLDAAAKAKNVSQPAEVTPTVTQPAVPPPPPPGIDISSMTPEQYAHAHANLTLQDIQSKGIQPDLGNYLDTYNTALKTGLEYQKGIASKLADTKIDLEKKVAEAPIDLAKAKQQELDKDSVSKETQDKVAGFSDSWSTIGQINNGWDAAHTSGAGFGTTIQSRIPFVKDLNEAFSPTVRAYHTMVKTSMTPLAKGVMGDNAQQAGEPRVQQALMEALPDIHDSPNSKNMKLDVWRQKVYTNAQNFILAKSAAGEDVSPYAKQLAPILRWGQEKSQQQQQQQLVISGMSADGHARLNAGAATPTNTPNAAPTNTPTPTSTPTGSTGTKVASGSDAAPDFFKQLLGLK